MIVRNVAGEQCLEVYLDFTINNTPLLISGAVIDFSAVVVTDFFVMTDPEIISFEVHLVNWFTPLAHIANTK